MARFVFLRAVDEESALANASAKLNIPRQDLKAEQFGPSQFKVNVLRGPGEFQFFISPDRIRCTLKKIIRPVGDGFVVSVEEGLAQLRRANVIHGIRMETLAACVQRMLELPPEQESADFNEIIAEGKLPGEPTPEKITYFFDTEKAERRSPDLVAMPGEILAEIVAGRPGADGMDVTGRTIRARLMERAAALVGVGVREESVSEGVKRLVASVYGTVSLIGAKLQVTPLLSVDPDGERATADLFPAGFSGRPLTVDMLLEALKAESVTHQIKPVDALKRMVDKVIREKKKISQAVLAEWLAPVDGQKQERIDLFATYEKGSAVDKVRADNKVVFPGQVAIQLRSTEKRDGLTIFGRRMKARDGEQVEIFPGPGIKRAIAEDGAINFVSERYGRVAIVEGRVTVESIVRVSADSMTAEIDIFPHPLLEVSVILGALRDAEVMHGIQTKEITDNVQRAKSTNKIIRGVVAARGTPVTPGTSAKLRYFFDPGIFSNPEYLAGKIRGPSVAPGSVIMQKVNPRDAIEGKTVFRERIAIPPEAQARDLDLDLGEFVKATRTSESTDYVSTVYGIVYWKKPWLNVQPPIQISASEMEVTMDIFPTGFDGTRITVEMIMDALQKFGVRVGIDTAAIEAALANREPTLNAVVARAIPSENGASAYIRYMFTVDGVLPNDAPPVPTSQRTRLDFFLDGEKIGEKVPAQQGKEGRTVLGRKIPAANGADIPIRKADRIRRADDGISLLVDQPGGGFISIENRNIVVVPMVTVAEDRMSAQISLYPPSDPTRALSKSRIMTALQNAGVTHGIQESDIERALAHLEESGRPVFNLPIAAATPPRDGLDGKVQLAIDTEGKVGQTRDDESIDYKQRSLYKSVKKFQLLATLHPPSPPTPGLNVLGEAIPGKVGKAAELRMGSGVVASHDGREYRAEIDGILHYYETGISVADGILVKGDVGLETGNIEEMAQPIFVAGNVKPDFRISSTRLISIGQVAEACHIRSDESVRIEGGVVGRGKGAIWSGGDVEAMYVNQARIEALGDIHIRAEILHSHIYCRGMITCTRDVGTVIGGEIWAYMGLQVKKLGAQGSDNSTVVYLGRDYFSHTEINKQLEDESIDARIRQYQEELRLITEEVKGMAADDRAKSDPVAFQELQTKRQEIAQELRNLEVYQTSMLSKIQRNQNAKIEVLHTLYPRVKIIYEDVVLEVREQTPRCIISYDPVKRNLYVKRV